MKDALGSVANVLVLGAGSEIAASTAGRLVDRGARLVVLAGRREAELEPSAEILRSRGATRVDVTRFDALAFDEHEKLVDDLFDQYGDFDVVLMAFGVLGEQAVAEEDAAAAREIALTNYVGAVSIGIPIARRLADQGHGTLVVLSSLAAVRARRSNFIYGSSKGGLDMFAQGLDYKLRDAGVQVLIVRPGFVRTKMTEGMKPLPLAVSAEDVASAIVKGVERGARIVWVPPLLRLGAVALRLLPSPVLRRLPI